MKSAVNLRLENQEIIFTSEINAGFLFSCIVPICIEIQGMYFNTLYVFQYMYFNIFQ